MEAHDVGDRIPLREDVDRLDVIGGRHRALDGELERHGVAVLGQLRQLDLHPARLDLGALAEHLVHGLDHGFRRRQRVIGGARQRQDGDRARQHGAPRNLVRAMAHGHLSSSQRSVMR
jgi:hypothetical protein